MEVGSAECSAPAGSPASANAVEVMAERAFRWRAPGGAGGRGDAGTGGPGDRHGREYKAIIARVTPAHAGKVRLLTSF
ncbi:MAG: hypothetical protein U1F77_08060 [Kiritimatiellia bacterium]